MKVMVFQLLKVQMAKKIQNMIVQLVGTEVMVRVLFCS